MTAYVFVGPSLHPARLQNLDGMVCLPPAAQGDVYRATEAGATAIGLIDGYFEGVPAVWHKEILWALSRSVAVFGAASMGALRAAELATFGMRGVGRIFEAYYDGTLTDDDEVAVQHGPAALGYVALSEPMVNVRATLDRAIAASVIDGEAGRLLVACAKSIFYQDRTWDAVLSAAQTEGLATDRLDGLRDWLPEGRVDQKASDAEAMLAEMSAWLDAGSPAEDVAFDFEWTDAWETAIATPQTVAADPTDQRSAVNQARVIDELRLDPEAYRVAKTAALARLLALRGADRTNTQAPRHAARAALDELRARHGLYRRADLDRWLEEVGLSGRELERLVEDEARARAYTAGYELSLDTPLLDHLRMSDGYVSLAERAQRKQQALWETALPDPDAATLGMAPPQLLVWYFEDRLQRPIPDDLDSYIADLGLEGRKQFYRLLSREYLFLSESARGKERQ